MQAAAAIKPIPPHFSQGLRDIISSMLKRNPEERPNIENIMATPIMVNVLVNLGTDVGRLPCTRYDCACLHYIPTRECSLTYLHCSLL